MTAQFMRALVFDGPASDSSTSRVADLPVPEPGEGRVSVDVTHAGVNFKDIMARRGDAGYVPAWPFVPGLEVAGTVRALGQGVDTLQVGQPVVAFTGAGGLADVAVADAALTVALPAGLAPARAAAAPGALLTAALLVEDFGCLRAGQTLLVHGAAGGVGQAVAQLARVHGAERILGTVGSPARVAASERAGYRAAFVRGPNTVEAIQQATGGGGAHLILDPQGTELLDLDLQVAAAGARIILFGNATGRPLAALPAAGRLMAANVSIAGFSLAALAVSDPGRFTNALARVLQHLLAGRLDPDLTLIDGLAGTPDAQQALAEGRGRGKYVVELTANAATGTTSAA